MVALRPKDQMSEKKINTLKFLSFVAIWCLSMWFLEIKHPIYDRHFHGKEISFRALTVRDRTIYNDSAHNPRAARQSPHKKVKGTSHAIRH